MPIKREFFEKLEGLSKEHIETIMAEIGKDVESNKAIISAKEQELATKNAEIQGLKTQIGDRDKDIATLKTQAGNSESINSKLTELQTKYEKETTELKGQLTKQERKFATEKFFGNVKFSSELARKAALADFEAKEFKYENNDFVGGKEFLEDLKKTQPAAFVLEETGDEGGADNGGTPPPPVFAKSQKADGAKGSPGVFDFSKGYTFVRKPPTAEK